MRSGESAAARDSIDAPPERGDPPTRDTETPHEAADAAPAEAPGREFVIRIRRRRDAPPWRFSRVAGWAGGALFGDPVLILTPLFFFIVHMLVAFSLGAPGRPEVLLPLVSLPPVDAFQDIIVLDLGSRGDVATWVLRVVLLLVRTATFGILLHLAVQRARDELPSLGTAAAFVRRRAGTLAFLELLSFAAFGVTLSLSADLTSTRDDGAIGTALLFGVLLLIGMFVAAAREEVPASTAVRHGLRRIVRRPLGHLGLVLAYGIGSNGLFRLASLGETGWPRAIPLTLYSFLSALLTMWFLLAFARRQTMLGAETPPQAIPEAQAEA